MSWSYLRAVLLVASDWAFGSALGYLALALFWGGWLGRGETLALAMLAVIHTLNRVALTAARSATTNDSNMMTRSSIPAALNCLGFALSVVILTSSTILFAVIYAGLTAWLAEFQLHVLFYLIVLPVILATIAGLAVPMRQLLDGGWR